MLDLHYIREHTDEVAAALKSRGVELTLDRVLELDGKRRDAILEVEGLKKQRNESSRRIGEGSLENSRKR